MKEKALAIVWQLGKDELTRGSRRLTALRQLDFDFGVWARFIAALPGDLADLQEALDTESSSDPGTVFPCDLTPRAPILGLWREERLMADLAADLDLDHRTAFHNFAVAVREASLLIDSLALFGTESAHFGDGGSLPMEGYIMDSNAIEQLERAIKIASELYARIELALEILVEDDQAKSLLRELTRPAGK